MNDVIALGELLIDFASRSADAAGLSTEFSVGIPASGTRPWSRSA